MAQLSAWQDYAVHKLYLQQISIPLTVRNNIRILPGKTGILTLTIQLNKTSFTPRHTIIAKGIAYVKPLDQDLPLRPIEIEFENNRCCIEVHNTSDSTVEFLPGQEMAYFDARSKGLVQINNSKHFPIDQYLHDRMTPATLCPSPLAYEKPIHPTARCFLLVSAVSGPFTSRLAVCICFSWFSRSEVRAFVLGNICERFARRDLC